MTLQQIQKTAEAPMTSHDLAGLHDDEIFDWSEAAIRSAKAEMKDLLWGAADLRRPKGFNARHLVYLLHLRVPKTMDEIETRIVHQRPTVEKNIRQLCRMGLVKTMVTRSEIRFVRVDLNRTGYQALFSPLPLPKLKRDLYDALTSAMTINEISLRLDLDNKLTKMLVAKMRKANLLKSDRLQPGSRHKAYIQAHLDFPSFSLDTQKLTDGEILKYLDTPKTLAMLVAKMPQSYDCVVAPLVNRIKNGYVKVAKLDRITPSFYYRASDNLDPARIVLENMEISDFELAFLRLVPWEATAISSDLYKRMPATNYRDRARYYRAVNRLSACGLLKRSAVDNIRLISLTDRGRDVLSYRKAAGTPASPDATPNNVVIFSEQGLPTKKLKLLATLKRLGTASSFEIGLALGDLFQRRNGGKAHVAPSLVELTQDGLIERIDADRHVRATFRLKTPGKKLIARYPDHSSLPSHDEMLQRIAIGRKSRYEKQCLSKRASSGVNSIHALLKASGPLTDREIFKRQTFGYTTFEGVKKALQILQVDGLAESRGENQRLGPRALWSAT